MGFFDDEDPFNNLIERMFGGNESFTEYEDSEGNKKFYKKSSENQDNLIETKKFFYFVLDLSGKKDIAVNVNRSSNTIEIKSGGETMEFYLPSNVAKKKFEWKFNNGILEVGFKK